MSHLYEAWPENISQVVKLLIDQTGCNKRGEEEDGKN